jgi:stress response protein YsnF
MVESTKPKENIEKDLSENDDDVIDASVLDSSDDGNRIATAESANSSPEIVRIIPVMEEDFDLTKKTVIHKTIVVKRAATRTEKIEVPIAYEEVFVNGKRLKVYDKEDEGLLSKIKDTIAHSVSSSDDDNMEYHYSTTSSSSSSPDSPSSNRSSKHNPNSNFNIKGETVALIEGQEKNETERVVPIWGEEIVVSKRKVKIGEVVIRRRRIIETKKIDVDIKKEKVSLEHPDGSKEELSTTP